MILCTHILCNTGSVDVNIEAVSAVNDIHQRSNGLVDNSTLECFSNDGASDDRAVKCCISNCYNDISRRRFVALQPTATDTQCKYIVSCTHNVISV